MMRYLPPLPGHPRIDRRRIPAGLAGTRATVAHVGRLIRDGARDFYVRQKAIDILLATGVAPKDYLGEIEALFRWVQRNVRYTKDPFRVEVLHSARRMLELRAGDCDDMTILLGALVKSVGHPVRVVLTGPDPARPQLFSHIYLEARHQDQWIPLDATMPYGLGWSPRAPVRQVIPIEEASSDERTSSRPSPSPNVPAAAGAGARPRTRVAAQPDARHSPGGGPAARPAGEGVVAPAAPQTVAGARSLATSAASAHLAEGPRGPSSSTNHAANPGAAPKLERGGPVAASPPRDAGRATRSRTAAPAATAQARRPSPRRDPAPDRPVPAAAARPADAAAAAGGGERARSPRRSGAEAAALYRSFTRAPARSVRRVAHPRVVPPVVVELGELSALVYRSSKWTGRPRSFIHFLDDPPRLVCDPAGRRLFIVGGSYRVTSRGIEG